MRVIDKAGTVTDYAKKIGKQVTNEYGQPGQYLYWGINGYTLGWCEPLLDGSYELVVIIGKYSTLTACRNAAV